MTRELDYMVGGSVAMDGAGVKLVRVLSRPTVTDFDPFLMLDAFDSKDPADYTKGFPWHPHRGIETVTYLVKGHIEHQDSLGNKGDIRDGGCQWMTAGGGILHQEMPMASPRMLGLQLWLNLPRTDKMTPPKYHDIVASDVKVVEEDGAKIKVVAGQYKDVKGFMEGEHVKMNMLEIELEPGKSLELATPEDRTVFVYLYAGDGTMGSQNKQIDTRRAALTTKGSSLKLSASDKGMHAMVFMAKPLNEPVSWGGPIVMNTREELMLAFDELDKGTFIKK